MSAETLNLTPKLYAYYQEISLREPRVLKQLRAKTHELSSARMQISPEQGQFMGLLIELLQAKKTLDIGTFTGYSALVVALHLPSNGKVIACDVSKEWTDIAQKFWQEAKVANKIDLKLGPALDTLTALINAGEANSFDFAFIDADKANYDHYYESALALVRKGGLIAIDNVLWGGDVADELIQDKETNAFRMLNAKLQKDDRITLSMLPIGDGLTLALKR